MLDWQETKDGLQAFADNVWFKIYEDAADYPPSLVLEVRIGASDPLRYRFTTMDKARRKAVIVCGALKGAE